MKRYRLPFVLITAMCILFFSLNPSSPQTAYSDKFRKDVEDQRQRGLRDVEQVRAELRAIQKMIRDKHLQFRAEMTDALKHRIEDITGLKKPSQLGDTARSQSLKSGKALKSMLQSRKGRRPRNVRASSFYLSEDESFWYVPPEEQQYQPSEPPSWEQPPLDDNRYAPGGEFGPQQDQYAKQEQIPREQPREEKRVEPRIEPKEEAVEVGYLVNPAAAAFNLRDKNLTTPIRAQQTCGSCWAFTTIALVETSYKIQTKKDLDLSEQQIVDCAIGADGQRAGSCDGGWYGSALESLQKNGAVLESASPYRNKNFICAGFMPSPYKVATWSFIRPDDSLPSVSDIKKAIARYGAIATCVKVTPAFQAYAGGVFDEHVRLNDANDQNHAVVLVGWDDKKGRRGSFLLRNSWGREWGENGYMWIEYECNGVGAHSIWAIAEAK